MTEQPRGIISDKMIDGILADCRLNEAGFKMPAPHCHPYFELFYVESGACSFFLLTTTCTTWERATFC